MKQIIAVFLTFVIAFFLVVPTVGCSADQIMAGLQDAQLVADQAGQILAPVNPELAAYASVVSKDLGVIIKTYNDYEAALPGEKANLAQLIQATAAGIRANLSRLLAAAGVKNPQMLVEVSTFVAVANSALIVLLAKVAPPGAVVTKAAVIAAGDELPVVKGAKSAADLKKAWNNAVAKSFPKAKI